MRRITVSGNLVSDAVGKDGYYYFTVAENSGVNNEAIYYTCFDHSISEERAKHFVKGSLITVYGIPTEKIVTNDVTHVQEISRTISVRDVELLFKKKAE